MSSYEFSHEALCLLLEERDAKIGRLKEELEVIKVLHDAACEGYFKALDQLSEANGAIEHLEMLYAHESKQRKEAHQAGWRQAKMEAEALISNLPREIYSTRVTSKYIAAMEYKEG